MTNKAIYPGTFDPLTKGHLDLLTRAAKIFDNVILAIADNPSKYPLFNLDERIVLATEVAAHLSNVQVTGFKGLMTEFACQQQANIIVRGIRTITDVDYEIQLAKMNRHLMPSLETIFILPNEAWSCISSTLLKEIVKYGGNIDRFLPISTSKDILSKLYKL